MKTTLIKTTMVFLFATTLLSACKKDEVEGNDEEVITTLQLSFVPVGGGATLSYQYDDADGPGGNAPTQDVIILSPAKTYNVTLQLLNKTANPVENVTAEVEDEAEAHRFYYTPAAGSNITVASLNNDANGIPLGITSTWTTGAAANGKVKITLRHYPAVPPNKAAGDMVNDPKSGTDIEVEFVTKIQ